MVDVRGKVEDVYTGGGAIGDAVGSTKKGKLKFNQTEDNPQRNYLLHSLLGYAPPEIA